MSYICYPLFLYRIRFVSCVYYICDPAYILLSQLTPSQTTYSLSLLLIVLSFLLLLLLLIVALLIFIIIIIFNALIIFFTRIEFLHYLCQKQHPRFYISVILEVNKIAVSPQYTFGCYFILYEVH